MNRPVLAIASFVAFAAFAGPPGDAPRNTTLTADPPAAKKQYATLQTSMGNIVVRLLPDEAPKTVANFVGLAKGTKEWTDPRTGKPTKAKLYDGTIFHRVIAGFMIQGGDPLGTGYGGPGYEFENESLTGRRFDKVGLMAMANHGRDTNGSQFFITVSTPKSLNGGYTIFGEVVEGYDVVLKISQVATGPRDRPLQDVVLKKVTISDSKP